MKKGGGRGGIPGEHSLRTRLSIPSIEGPQTERDPTVDEVRGLLSVGEERGGRGGIHGEHSLRSRLSIPSMEGPQTERDSTVDEVRGLLSVGKGRDGEGCHSERNVFRIKRNCKWRSKRSTRLGFFP